jgi:hypothetical protein
MTRNISIEEFDTISKQYALDHIEEQSYKWMKTKQPTDFNFDSYIEVTYKTIENKPYITLTNKHPDFQMTNFLITTYEGNSYPRENYSSNNIDMTHKSHTVQIDESKVTGICALITPIDKHSGILDMFLEQ